MVARISERSITDNFLPSVFIERITLESSALSPPMHNLDPHIQNNYRGENIGINFLNENSDNAAAAEKRANEQSLRVSIDLSVKQKITNSTNLALSWLAGLDLQRYLQIAVLQTTDPLVSEMLSYRNTLFSLLIAENPDQAEFIEAYRKAISPKFPRMSMNAAFRRLQASLEKYPVQYLSMNDVRESRRERFGGDDNNILDPENKFKDAAGNTYQDVPFFMQFELDEPRPTHLAYYAVTVLDIQRIIQDFELEPDAAGTIALEGKRTVDYVIDGGRVVSQAYVYHNQSGEIWAGPVHFRGTPPTPYAGNLGDSENPERLSRRTVPNNKVQDFRISDKLKRYTVDTSSVKNMLNSSLFTAKMRSLARDQNLTKEASFWSSLALSKDEKENINYFFSINLKDILRKHTKYGHLFHGDEDNALSSMRIVSMKMFRRRVKKVDILNKLGSPVNAEYVYDQNEEPVLLGTYGEGGDGNSDGLRELTNLHPSMPGVVHFSGTDVSMKDITYGHYRYEVEIDVEDNTTKFFQHAFDDMIEQRNRFEEYYEWTKQPQNFQVATNRFTTDARDSTEWNHIIENTIGTFVTHFNHLRMKQGIDPQNEQNKPYRISGEDTRNLAKMSYPSTATPHSVGLVLDLLDHLLETYSHILGYNLGSSSGASLDPNTMKLQGQGRKGTVDKGAAIKLYHHFREVWDSDIPKNYGYNYLDVVSSDLPGINTMSGVSLQERANIEIATFFNEPGEIRLADDKIDLGVFDTEECKFSFFSPASVNLGGGKVSLGPTETFNADINDAVIAGIASMNFSFGSPNLAGALGALFKHQDDAVRSNFGAIAEFSSAASMVNSIVKNDQDFSVFVAPQEREEEFNGRTMSADCPPEEQEDRDDTPDSEKKSGLANAPQIKTGVSQKGAEGLRKYLAFESVMMGTGINANFGMNGKNFRAPEIRKGVMTAVKDKNKMTGVANLMGKMVDKVTKSRGRKKGKSQKRISKKGKYGPFQDMNVLNREMRAASKFAATLKRNAGKPNQNKYSAISALPPQILSLSAGAKARVSAEALTAGGQIDPNLAAETFATTILNYHCLGELQFFTGYQRGKDDDMFMNLPTFDRLDRTRLILNAGKRLLCRIVRHEDKELGFVEPKGLVMPIYDRYFILDVIEGVAGLFEPIAEPQASPARQETVAAIEQAGAIARNRAPLAGALGANAQNIPPWAATAMRVGIRESDEFDRGEVGGAGANYMLNNIRRDRERQAVLHRDQQWRCWSELRGDGTILPPEDWDDYAPTGTDWCMELELEGVRQDEADNAILTPEEEQLQRLYCRKLFSEHPDCERYYMGYASTQRIAVDLFIQRCRTPRGGSVAERLYEAEVARQGGRRVDQSLLGSCRPQHPTLRFDGRREGALPANSRCCNPRHTYGYQVHIPGT